MRGGNLISFFSDTFFIFYKSVLIILTGWFLLFSKAFSFTYHYILAKRWEDRVLAFLLLCQLVASGSGWFQYKILFFESDEIVTFSSKWNFFFILTTLVSFFLYVFWKSPWVKKAFLLLQGLQMVFLALGFWKPKWIFTDFLRAEDYTYSLGFQVFSVCLISSLVIVLGTIKKEIS